MAYSMDSKVGDILDDPHAKEVLERYAPGITNNTMIGMAKGMSLRSIVDMPQAKQAGITEQTVQRVLAEINSGKS